MAATLFTHPVSAPETSMDGMTTTPVSPCQAPVAGCALHSLGHFFFFAYTGQTGTTGTPKGVDVSHKNVCNLVCNSPGDLGIAEGVRVGQVLNVSFDMGMLERWQI